MKMAKIRYVPQNTEETTDQWAGLNKNALIADNQFSSTTNMSTKNFPYPSPRPPRESKYTLTSGKALYSADDKLAWVDDVTFTSAAGDITFGEHTITSAASAFSGIAVGDTLTITGCTVNTDNNTTCIVTTATAAMLTCSATTFTIVAGSPAGKETAAITFTGCSFKYDEVTEGAVTSSSKSMVDFNGKIGIFPDKKTYDYVNDAFAAITGKCQLLNYGYDADGEVDYDLDTRIRSKNISAVLPSTSYTLTNDKAYASARAYYYDSSLVFISTATVNFASFTTPATCYYLNFDITGTDLSTVVTITNATYPTQTAIPDIDYATTLDNRVWGFEGDDIYTCALGDITDWTTFSTPTLATDSWHTDTGYPGNFTGCATYRKAVYGFKETLMLKLYGDIPENFQFLKVTNLGCIDNESIKEVNNILFFLGNMGVYAFNGGIPDLISADLNETYVSGVAGGDNRRYYICLYNGTDYNLYVYDTWTNVWCREDDLNVTEFTFCDGYLYALTSDHEVLKFDSGDEVVTMILISKKFTGNSFDKKAIKELYLRADLDTGTLLSVSKSTDGSDYVSLESKYYKTGKATVRIPVGVKRCDNYQVKIEMNGDGKLEDLKKVSYKGGI